MSSLPAPDMQVAQRGDEAMRTVLAARGSTPPELLFFLANDPAPTVRVAVAANGASPPLADRLLATDVDPRVRRVLARKIAAMAPGLDPDAQDRLRRQAWDTLCLLVEDQVVGVRAAIAEIVAEMPDAPRALILRLAGDTAMPVAEPVLRLSTVLTQDDLLTLVASPPVPETLCAIARRPGLGEALSDAIVRTSQSPAIADLLSNPSAAIREATLDALVLQAAENEDWHEALVHRPRLPPRTARALADIVADVLMRELAARPDLPPNLADELHRRVLQRVGTEGEQTSDETLFIEAALRGDTEHCTQILARRTGLQNAVIGQAIVLRGAKALVSLCWRAGLSPAAARAAQNGLVDRAPDEVLPTKTDWPLGQDEMRWQVDLLRGH